MRLFVTVKAGARKEEVKRLDETHFAVSVKALPIEGKGNAAVIKALSKFLGIAPSRLSLRAGSTGRSKVFNCEG